MLVHLSVQNPISQNLLQLAEQAVARKYRLRISTLQQIVDNLFLDRRDVLLREIWLKHTRI